MMKTIIFKVNGMSCAHCEARITQNLSKRKGVTLAKANRLKNEVVVAYDDTKITPLDLQKIIEDTGYDVAV